MSFNSDKSSTIRFGYLPGNRRAASQNQTGSTSAAQTGSTSATQKPTTPTPTTFGSAKPAAPLSKNFMISLGDGPKIPLNINLQQPSHPYLSKFKLPSNASERFYQVDIAQILADMPRDIQTQKDFEDHFTNTATKLALKGAIMPK